VHTEKHVGRGRAKCLRQIGDKARDPLTGEDLRRKILNRSPRCLRWSAMSMRGNKEPAYSSGSHSGAEEARIKAAYARREAVVDRLLYSYFNPGNLFIIQDRVRQILALLKQCGRGALEGQKILEVGCGTSAFTLCRSWKHKAHWRGRELMGCP
jgi:hypothetical protein